MTAIKNTILIMIIRQIVLCLPFLSFSNFLLIGQNQILFPNDSNFIFQNQDKYIAFESCFSNESTISYPSLDYILKEKRKFKEKEKYVFESNGKYGIINRNGKIIDSASYDYFSIKTCGDFYFAYKSDHWIVFDKTLTQISIEEYEDVFFQKDKSAYLFKKEGKWGIKSIKNIDLLKPKYDFLKTITNNLLLYKKKQKYGVVSMKGKIIYQANEKITIHQNKPYLYIKKAKKLGVIINDSLILKPKYDRIKAFKLNPNKYVFLIVKDKKWSVYYNKEKIIPLGFVHSNNELRMSIGFHKYIKKKKWGVLRQKNEEFIVYDAKYDEISQPRSIDIYSKHKYLKVRKNKLWGLIDLDNNLIADFLYEEIYRFDDKHFIVKKNGKWGSIDTSGKQLIEPVYDEFEYDQPFIYSKNNNKYVLLKINGKKIYESDSKFELRYTDDLEKNGYCYLVNNRKMGMISKDGLLMLKPIYNNIINYCKGNGDIKELGFLINKDREWGVFYKLKQYVAIGNVIPLSRYNKNNKFFIIKKSNKYSILLKQDDTLTVGNQLYDELIRQKSITQRYKNVEKPLIANINGKWGLIDYKENIIVDFLYDEIKPYGNYRYFIKKNEKWGLMDDKGETLRDFVFSKLEKINEEYIKSKVNDKYGIIDLWGSTLVKNVFDDIEWLYKTSKNTKLAIVKKNNKYGVINIKNNHKKHLDKQEQLKKEILMKNPNAIYVSINEGGKTILPVINDKIIYIKYSTKSNITIDYFLTINKNVFNIYKSNGEKLPDTKYSIDYNKEKEYFLITFENKDKVTISINGHIISINKNKY